MDYKDTLLMPQTNFEMRGQLNKKDALFVKEQLSSLLYEKVSTRKGKAFILHDGPPYANGNIHIGHALNKILKDFVIRDQVLQGKKVNWELGWDTHGLPIELKVQKANPELKNADKSEYLAACKKYVLEQVKNQEEQFMSLGILTDPNKKYLTLDHDFVANEISIFHAMLNKGLIYQDLKPVYWSWSSKTALAEAEVEYAVKPAYSIYLKFKLENTDLSFVIWTTTPWTIPANVALAFGERIAYSIVDYNGEKLVVATELIGTLEQKFATKLKVIANFNPNEYIGKNAINPLNGATSKLVWGHHVSIDDGTGIVHIAGGHGIDDYLIAKKENLPLLVVIDDLGHMQNAGEFDGQFYEKANKLILEALADDLIISSKIEHAVPIDWRTKKPIVYRATKQWFVSIEKVKVAVIDNATNVEWFPAWGKERLVGMTKNRDDWCISRQRVWGVPIPIIYDQDNKPLINQKLQQEIELLFAKEGIIGWQNLDIEKLLPKEIKYNKGMHQEVDILDVWFDSGSSWKTVLGTNQIADVYLEGNDQYRGWFNSSLITSTIIQGTAPYKNVITHGMVTDGKGNKMSKSIGNTIDPLKITHEFGNDILRLMIANANYQDNVKISQELIKQTTNDYRKIRNTIRFILGNLADYDGSEVELTSITKLILDNINAVWTQIRINYANFNYVNIAKEIMQEITSGSISYLLDYAKDVLYVFKENDQERRAIQFVLTKILDLLLYAMAPLIPLTVEEAYKQDNSKESIFLTTYPNFPKGNRTPWIEFNQIREVVNKEIEILREDKLLKSSHQAVIAITLPKEYLYLQAHLKDYLMVAKLIVTSGESLAVKATVFEGKKCARCWKIFDEQEITDDICKHCKEVLAK